MKASINIVKLSPGKEEEEEVDDDFVESVS
jgi:hypothetical protein